MLFKTLPLAALVAVALGLPAPQQPSITPSSVPTNLPQPGDSNGGWPSAIDGDHPIPSGFTPPAGGSFTGLPSGFPSVFPSGLPSGLPSGFPTSRPTGLPTGFPNGGVPTGVLTGLPTGFPSVPSGSP
ncbi:hypothetical protein F4813DRAFT_210959 [Daldinia decipiens]|uniref:uncharacterized protein n=1 Tax=Daldinia decipiens TaxID=326647 RepID=UPI0020C4B48E|nr:uncharacterized protein F4813DRAFT_210959 [Daldinia decipiens]KAI1654272.1 hypothetical protein F4813DRAFT_210959 [Daldinia decipiens]